MQKIFEADYRLVTSGLTPALMLAQTPLWTDGLGVVFSDASAQNFPGRTSAFEFSGAPLDLAQAFVENFPRVYFGTTQQVVRYIAGIGQTTLVTGSYGYWYLVPWGDWLIATDGISPVLVSKNTGSLVPLAGTTFDYARIVEKYANYVVAMNTSNGANMVEWSTLDNPEVWTPAVDNTAGFYPIRDMDSGIVATSALGSAQAIYSADQMFLMNYTTDTSVVMSIKPQLQGVGAVSKRSVISDGGYNWGLTRRGVFKTDGVGKQYVDEPRIRKTLRNLVDWDRQEAIYGSLDEARHLVQWNLPTVTGGNKTVAYDFEGDSWTYPHEDVHISGEEGIFSGLLLAEDSELSIVGEGTPKASWIQSKPIDCGDREKTKTFQMLRMDIEADLGVVVEVAYCYESINDTVTFTQSYPAAEQIPLEEQDAVAIVLKISAPAGKSWRLSGFSLHGVPTGNVV